MEAADLTVASNRLPVRLVRDGDGAWRARTSSGGLVSALRPVLRRLGGVWVGWCGACGLPRTRVRKLLRSVEEGFDLDAVTLEEADRERYYLGFSNRMLWPVLHGLPRFAEPRPGDWTAYQRVNARFARALASSGAGPVWVHDYHLMLVAAELRRLRCRRPVGYFLHTPFPEPDVLRRLPRWAEIVRGLACFGRLGFQTDRDRRNFLAAVEALRNEACESLERSPAGGPGGPLDGRVGVFPISIDAEDWSRRSAEPEVARRARRIRDEQSGRTLLLGVDRLDYTKGIPARLRGYARALAMRPGLRGRVTLRQLAVPSRGEIPAYAALGREVETLVDEVNHRFGTADWTPVEYIVGSWDDEELVAQYRAADVALVTPLRDGMNLVAKEYCASQTGEPGALVLSRYAGSARQLDDGAILVDPRDDDELAAAVARAVEMPADERARRMGALRRTVRAEDVHAWASDFLGALRSAPVPGVPPEPPSIGSGPARRPARPGREQPPTRAGG